MLDAAGADWTDIVDVTVFLTHMGEDFATLNRLWAEQFPDEATRPTRTTVEVSRPADARSTSSSRSSPGVEGVEMKEPR